MNSARHCSPLLRYSRSLRTCSMPLRAKILNPVFLAKATMSTEAAQEDEVRFLSKRATRTVQLTRPKKLNALNTSMVEKITPRVLSWRRSDAAKILLIKGDDRAFSAGGDVASVALADGPEPGVDFFSKEYILDYILASYPKPVVSLINGITMGGGAGLSVHGQFRIATEKTVFAMPETLIGFYPDVGTSFFLSRLDGELGTFLALTGERLNGFDALLGGAATHYVNSSDLAELETRLAELDQSGQSLDAKKFAALVNSAISDFEVKPTDEGHSFAYGGEIREIIDDAFRFDTVEEIKERLGALESTSKFAKKTLDILNLRSPTSVKVALGAVRAGRNLDILEAFKLDVHIASTFMSSPDFLTGVNYRVIKKLNGRADWLPEPSNEQVRDTFLKPDYTEASPLSDVYKKLEEISDGFTFKDYPFNYGLPTETEVKSYILGESKSSGPYLSTKEEIISHFLEDYNNKVGVRTKVAEILNRKTKVVKGHEQEHLVNWVE
ncbi:ClpP/crotonase-like domain-containing protein [Lipomyces japonicus]|uniref:mitochondrial 37S ribosomal protein mS47 n=1 Tax=Lipomyces japonicus TaxID=56871 RepID=UPI0034CFED6D